MLDAKTKMVKNKNKQKPKTYSCHCQQAGFSQDKQMSKRSKRPARPSLKCKLLTTETEKSMVI